MRIIFFFLSLLFGLVGFLMWVFSDSTGGTISGAIGVLAGVLCLAVAALIEAIARESAKIRAEIVNNAAAGDTTPGKRYYISMRNQAEGPYSETIVRRLQSVGAVTSSTPIALAGEDRWRSVGELFPQ